MLSTTAAARPFMKTERTSFMAAASPGSSETTATGMPSGTNTSANARRARARGEGGSLEPSLGHGPEQRHVGEAGCPDRVTSAATSRFSAGDAVFRSA